MAIVRALVLAALAVVAVGISPGSAKAQSEVAVRPNVPQPTPVKRGVPEISTVGLGGVAVLLVGGVLLFGARRYRRRQG